MWTGLRGVGHLRPEPGSASAELNIINPALISTILVVVKASVTGWTSDCYTPNLHSHG